MAEKLVGRSLHWSRARWQSVRHEDFFQLETGHPPKQMPLGAACLEASMTAPTNKGPPLKNLLLCHRCQTLNALHSQSVVVKQRRSISHLQLNAGAIQAQQFGIRAMRFAPSLCLKRKRSLLPQFFHQDIALGMKAYVQRQQSQNRPKPRPPHGCSTTAPWLSGWKESSSHERKK